MEMRIQLLVVKSRQQMVFPLAPFNGFSDLVVHIEALQIFVCGIGKAVQLIVFAPGARRIDDTLMGINI